MTAEQARALFLEHCQPGDRGTLERYGEKAAVAAILAAFGAERERCAVLCEHYSEVNMEICGDTVLLDPVLRGHGFTPANIEASEAYQIKGVIHSAHHHAGQHLAAAIRSSRGDAC